MFLQEILFKWGLLLLQIWTKMHWYLFSEWDNVASDEDEDELDFELDINEDDQED